MAKIIVDALVPIFAGLLLGFGAGRRGLMDNLNVRTLIALVVSISAPCALFLIIPILPGQFSKSRFGRPWRLGSRSQFSMLCAISGRGALEILSPKAL
jgi:hypothetical protein